MRIPAAVRKFPPQKLAFETTVATNVLSIDRSGPVAHRLSRIAREEEFIMNALNRYLRPEFLTLLLGIAAALGGCVPVQTATRPTLDEARLGNVRSANVEDDRLRPGEIEGEIVELNRARREIYVVAADGRRETLPYDFDRTRVVYHGQEYTIDNLESGDRIAYPSTPPAGRYVDVIRIEEPVQARSGSRFSQAAPTRRREVIDGTVDRIDQKLGVFDLRPRDGRNITVSLPYNARAADVDSFRTLRRGDPVRVEGEFVSPENFQLLSFLWSR